MTDPFGYYSGRPIGERVPELGHLYYPNFPHESSVWNINAPGEYDAEVEDEDFKK